MIDILITPVEHQDEAEGFNLIWALDVTLFRAGPCGALFLSSPLSAGNLH